MHGTGPLSPAARCANLFRVAAVGTALALLPLWPIPAVGVSADTERQLREAEYVYIASARKDGSFGEAAEIWFLYRDGAVYVGTRPSSWRARRIEWGRPQARIWVGKRDGLQLEATGAVVRDAEIEKLLMETFAEKYPGGWPRHEENFRKGFADGSRVIVKYVLKTD